MRGAVKLNLGGGHIRIPGYLQVDKQPEWLGVRADIVADLEEGLPFEDRSVDVINVAHVFEHINNFIPLMDECWRVLKDDGFMMVAVPVFPSVIAVSPPDHVRFFVPETFWYFWRSSKHPMRHKYWTSEMSIEMELPFRGKDSKDPQLFVLLRPDREEGDEASPNSDS